MKSLKKSEMKKAKGGAGGNAANKMGPLRTSDKVQHNQSHSSLNGGYGGWRGFAGGNFAHPCVVTDINSYCSALLGGGSGCQCACHGKWI